MARGGQHSDKERFWRDMVERWQRSGWAVRAFCDEHGLSEASFYSWRRIIAERNGQATSSAGQADNLPAFVPVRVASVVTASSGLEVVIGSRRVVRVPPGFDAATLRNLLAVLEEPPPC